MAKIPHDHVRLVGRVRVGERGQVVIPAEARDELGLEPGDHMLALQIGDSDAVAFVPESKLAGLIAQSGDQLAKSLKNINNQPNDRI